MKQDIEFRTPNDKIQSCAISLYLPYQPKTAIGRFLQAVRKKLGLKEKMRLYTGGIDLALGSDEFADVMAHTEAMPVDGKRELESERAYEAGYRSCVDAMRGWCKVCRYYVNTEDIPLAAAAYIPTCKNTDKLKRDAEKMHSHNHVYQFPKPPCKYWELIEKLVVAEDCRILE